MARKRNIKQEDLRAKQLADYLRQIEGSQLGKKPKKKRSTTLGIPAGSFVDRLLTQSAQDIVGMGTGLAYLGALGAEDVAATGLRAGESIIGKKHTGFTAETDRSGPLVRAMLRGTLDIPHHLKEDITHPLRNPGHLAVDIPTLMLPIVGKAAEAAGVARATYTGRGLRAADTAPHAIPEEPEATGLKYPDIRGGGDAGAPAAPEGPKPPKPSDPGLRRIQQGIMAEKEIKDLKKEIEVNADALNQMAPDDPHRIEVTRHIGQLQKRLDRLEGPKPRGTPKRPLKRLEAAVQRVRGQGAGEAAPPIEAAPPAPPSEPRPPAPAGSPNAPAALDLEPRHPSGKRVSSRARKDYWKGVHNALIDARNGLKKGSEGDATHVNHAAYPDPMTVDEINAELAKVQPHYDRSISDHAEAVSRATKNSAAARERAQSRYQKLVNMREQRDFPAESEHMLQLGNKAAEAGKYDEADQFYLAAINARELHFAEQQRLREGADIFPMEGGQYVAPEDFQGPGWMHYRQGRMPVQEGTPEGGLPSRLVSVQREYVPSVRGQPGAPPAPGAPESRYLKLGIEQTREGYRIVAMDSRGGWKAINPNIHFSTRDAAMNAAHEESLRHAQGKELHLQRRESALALHAKHEPAVSEEAANAAAQERKAGKAQETVKRSMAPLVSSDGRQILDETKKNINPKDLAPLAKDQQHIPINKKRYEAFRRKGRVAFGEIVVHRFSDGRIALAKGQSELLRFAVRAKNVQKIPVLVRDVSGKAPKEAFEAPESLGKSKVHKPAKAEAPAEGQLVTKKPTPSDAEKLSDADAARLRAEANKMTDDKAQAAEARLQGYKDAKISDDPKEIKKEIKRVADLIDVAKLNKLDPKIIVVAERFLAANKNKLREIEKGQAKLEKLKASSIDIDKRIEQVQRQLDTVVKTGKGGDAGQLRALRAELFAERERLQVQVKAASVPEEARTVAEIDSEIENLQQEIEDAYNKSESDEHIAVLNDHMERLVQEKKLLTEKPPEEPVAEPAAAVAKTEEVAGSTEATPGGFEVVSGAGGKKTAPKAETAAKPKAAKGKKAPAKKAEEPAAKAEPEPKESKYTDEEVGNFRDMVESTISEAKAENTKGVYEDLRSMGEKLTQMEKEHFGSTSHWGKEAIQVATDGLEALNKKAASGGGLPKWTFAVKTAEGKTLTRIKRSQTHEAAREEIHREFEGKDVTVTLKKGEKGGKTFKPEGKLAEPTKPPAKAEEPATEKPAEEGETFSEKLDRLSAEKNQARKEWEYLKEQKYKEVYTRLRAEDKEAGKDLSGRSVSDRQRRAHYEVAQDPQVLSLADRMDQTELAYLDVADPAKAKLHRDFMKRNPRPGERTTAAEAPVEEAPPEAPKAEASKPEPSGPPKKKFVYRVKDQGGAWRDAIVNAENKTEADRVIKDANYEASEFKPRHTKKAQAGEPFRQRRDVTEAEKKAWVEELLPKWEEHRAKNPNAPEKPGEKYIRQNLGVGYEKALALRDHLLGGETRGRGRPRKTGAPGPRQEQTSPRAQGTNIRTQGKNLGAINLRQNQLKKMGFPEEHIKTIQSEVQRLLKEEERAGVENPYFSGNFRSKTLKAFQDILGKEDGKRQFSVWYMPAKGGAHVQASMMEAIIAGLKAAVRPKKGGTIHMGYQESVARGVPQDLPIDIPIEDSLIARQFQFWRHGLYNIDNPTKVQRALQKAFFASDKSARMKAELKKVEQFRRDVKESGLLDPAQLAEAEKIVKANWVKYRNRKDRAKHLLDGLDTAQQITVLLALHMKPGYLPANIAGQLFITGAAHAFNPLSILTTSHLSHQAFGSLLIGKDTKGSLPKAMQRQLRSQALATMGSTMYQSLMHATRDLQGVSYNVAKRTKQINDAYSRILDDPYRLHLFTHNMKIQGFKTPEMIQHVMTAPEMSGKYHEIARRATADAIDFSMHDWERKTLRRIVFFYPWLKGSSKWTMRYIGEHPLQAAFLVSVGRKVHEQTQKELGPTPSYEDGIFVVGHRKVNGVSMPIIINPAAMGVSGNFAETMKIASNVFTGRGTESEEPTELLNPTALAAFTALTGFDPTKSRKVSPGKSQVIEGGKHYLDSVAVANVLRNLRRAGELGGEQKDPNKVLFPYNAWEAGGKFTLGSTFTPVAYNKAVGQSRAFAESLGRYSKAERVKLKHSRQIKLFNEAAKSVGMPPMPTQVRNAFILHADKMANRAAWQEHFGRRLEPKDRLQADVSFLVSRKLISEQQGKDMLKRWAGLTPSQMTKVDSMIVNRAINSTLMNRWATIVNAQLENVGKPKVAVP